MSWTLNQLYTNKDTSHTFYYSFTIVSYSCKIYPNLYSDVGEFVYVNNVKLDPNQKESTQFINIMLVYMVSKQAFLWDLKLFCHELWGSKFFEVFRRWFSVRFSNHFWSREDASVCHGFGWEKFIGICQKIISSDANLDIGATYARIVMRNRIAGKLLGFLIVGKKDNIACISFLMNWQSFSTYFIFSWNTWLHIQNPKTNNIYLQY